MEKLTAAAFGQRRKMLRGALKGLGGSQLLEAASIDPARRAETLTVQEFEQLMLVVKKVRPRSAAPWPYFLKVPASSADYCRLRSGASGADGLDAGASATSLPWPLAAMTVLPAGLL